MIAKFLNRIKRMTVLEPSPLFWGTIYLLAIPLFALWFRWMPDDWFKLGDSSDSLSNYVDALYFSAITITSLGYGDIYPVATGAKIAVMLESVFGITAIGVFMFAVGLRKNKIDSEEEKTRTELARINAEKQKLKRQKIVIHPYIDNYITYAICVSTPMRSRTGENVYNPNFSFQDLQDMFYPSLLLRDNHSIPAISHYYKWLKELESRLEKLLSTVDMSIWPDLEQDILYILKFFREYDSSSALLGMENQHWTRTVNGRTVSVKATESYADLIRNWKDEVVFHPHNSINQAIALYFQIKIAVPILQNLEQRIDHILTAEH